MSREGPRRAVFHDGAGHKTHAPRLAFWLGALTALITLMALVEITKLKIKRGTEIEHSIADEERSADRIQKEGVAAADSVVGITGFGAVPGRV